MERKITFRLPEEYYKRLVCYAKLNNITVSKAIREIIGIYIVN